MAGSKVDVVPCLLVENGTDNGWFFFRRSNFRDVPFRYGGHDGTEYSKEGVSTKQTAMVPGSPEARPTIWA